MSGDEKDAKNPVGEGGKGDSGDDKENDKNVGPSNKDKKERNKNGGEESEVETRVHRRGGGGGGARGGGGESSSGAGAREPSGSELAGMTPGPARGTGPGLPWREVGEGAGPTCQLGAESPVAALEGRSWRAA